MRHKLPTLLAQTREFDPDKEEVFIGEGGEKVATIKGLEAIFSNILSIALTLAGIVLFIMLLVGGFRYLTSGGDPKAKEAAQGTLTQAIAGLVILLLAFVILRFIAFITGVEGILNFTIVQPAKP